MSKCDTCHGCNKQEQKDFIPPGSCKEYINAYRCKCGMDMFKYPEKSVCPGCDRDEWVRLAKMYLNKHK